MHHSTYMSDLWVQRRSGWKQHQGDAREPFDVDYARIVHSGSFRRLQGKTQILNLGDSDFYRTRLTHSLEVAQIAGSIVRQLNFAYADHPAKRYLPTMSLIQAAGFGHDLGHPPFGHGGEVALNYCMRGLGGFEGNGHTLRLLLKLEDFSEEHGSNLTRRTMLAVLKYPIPFSVAANSAIVPKLDKQPTLIKTLDRKSCKPPKCYFDAEKDVVEWILDPLSNGDKDTFQSVEDGGANHHKAKYKSFDCSIMDLSDDIAYGVHDLEDAIALNLVTEKEFRDLVKEGACAPFLDHLKRTYPQDCGNNVYDYFVGGLFTSSKQRKRFIGRLVHLFVINVKIKTIEKLAEPLIRYCATIPKSHRDFLDMLQSLIETKVIFTPNVQHLEFKGQKMVVSVFKAMKPDPKNFLPADAYELLQKSSGDVRVICDYVAGSPA